MLNRVSVLIGGTLGRHYNGSLDMGDLHNLAGDFTILQNKDNMRGVDFVVTAAYVPVQSFYSSRVSFLGARSFMNRNTDQ
jgi:hypothetical protein